MVYSCNPVIIPEIYLEPQKSKVVKVPFMTFSPKPGKEYFLNVYALLKNEEPWGNPGEIIASEQLKLPFYASKNEVTKKISEELKINDTDNNIIVTNNIFKLTFDKKNGSITDYIVNGISLFEKGPVPNYWRAPTDNDFGNGMPERCADLEKC